MTVSGRTRFEVFRRDNHTCRYCGRRAPDVILTIDHVIPVALGGTDSPANLATACTACNAGKTSTAPDQATVDDVREDAARWAAALELVAQEQREAVVTEAAVLADFWRLWAGSDNGYGIKFLPDDWEASISQFRALGLTIEDLEHLVDVTAATGIASERRLWRYFCGCCWNTIRDRQSGAARIIDEGEV